jgi:hypothetical protein
MPDNLFTDLPNLWTDEELPAGHLKRFEKKLHERSGLSARLWTIQRIAIAASLAAFIVLSITVALNLQKFSARKAVLFGVSSELYESELFLKDEILKRMETIKASDNYDKQVLKDFDEIDESFSDVCAELQLNPNDDRLISAVIETYRMKLEALDELLEKTCENKI